MKIACLKILFVFYFIALPRRFVILKVTLNVELIWAALYVLCKKKTA